MNEIKKETKPTKSRPVRRPISALRRPTQIEMKKLEGMEVLDGQQEDDEGLLAVDAFRRVAGGSTSEKL